MFSTKTKKISAMITALVLAVVMMLPVNLGVASAAGAGSITITVPESDKGTHAYTAYQIFSGTYAEGVLTDINWGSAIAADKQADALTAVKGIVFFQDCTNVTEIAEKLATISKKDDDNTKAFADAIAPFVSTGVDAVNNIISGLDDGYYLVMDKAAPTGSGSTTPGVDNSGAYTKYILEVVGGSNVNVTAKTSAPTLVKKVEEKGYSGDFDGTFNDVADYSIGDEILFRIYVTVADNYKSYNSEYKLVVTDKMDSGLAYTGIESVIFGDTAAPEVSYSVISRDSQNVEITFPDLRNYDLTGKKITITYKAKLTEDAVIGLGGNKNTASLKYSNNPNSTTSTAEGTTPEDKVIVFTYSLGINKIDSTDSTKKLQGAEFVIYRLNGSDKEYVVTANGRVTGFAAEETTFVTDVDGNIKVAGLEDGTYYVEEKKAPAGYNLPQDAVTELVVAATTTNGQTWVDGDASKALTAITVNGVAGTVSEGVDVNVAVEIKNSKGSSLPTTGGMGTTILYIVGGILVVGAAILLISKKRMNNEE